MSDSSKILAAVESIRMDAPRESRHDGDDEIRCVLSVPPYKYARITKCSCGQIVWESMYKRDCGGCGGC